MVQWFLLLDFQPVSPVYGPIPTHSGELRSPSVSTVLHSDRPLPHERLYNVNASRCLTDQHFPHGHSSVLPQRLAPSLHQRQPLLHDGYVRNHAHSGENYTFRRLDSRYLLGTGARAGGAVYPTTCRDPCCHPQYLPSQHAWDAGYRRKSAAMTEVFDDLAGPDLARLPYSNTVNPCHCQRCPCACRYFPCQESFSPVPRRSLDGQVFSVPSKPPLLTSNAYCVYPANDHLPTHVERKSDKADHAFPSLGQTPASAVCNKNEIPACPDAQGLWTAGTRRDMVQITDTQTVTPNIDGNSSDRTYQTLSGGLGSNVISSQEQGCGLVSIAATVSPEEVMQDYAENMIAGEAVELPLDVAEETVVTCNTLSVVYHPSREETMLTSTIAPCPSEGAVEPSGHLSNSSVGFHGSQTQPSRPSSHGKQPDSLGFNQNETQAANGAWAYSPPHDENEHKSATPKWNLAHSEAFGAYQLPKEVRPEGGTHEATSTAPRMENTATKQGNGLNNNLLTSIVGRTEYNSNDSRELTFSPFSKEQEQARVVVQREERCDLTQLSGVSSHSCLLQCIPQV